MISKHFSKTQKIYIFIFLIKIHINNFYRSLARAALRHLEAKGFIRAVSDRHSKFTLFTTNTVKKEVVADVKATAKGAKGKK
jgi:ribosomal protein S25